MRQSAEPQALKLFEDKDAEKRLIDILYQCFLTMDLYGKQPEDFGAIKTMFFGFLKNYPGERVVAAFEKYARNRREFPTVSDIIAILDGRIKPNATYYAQLLKKRRDSGNYYLPSDEAEYVKKYEEQALDDWK